MEIATGNLGLSIEWSASRTFLNAWLRPFNFYRFNTTYQESLRETERSRSYKQYIAFMGVSTGVAGGWKIWTIDIMDEKRSWGIQDKKTRRRGAQMGTTQTASQYELRQTQSFSKILLSQRNYKKGETNHISLHVWKKGVESRISTYVSEQV